MGKKASVLYFTVPHLSLQTARTMLVFWKKKLKSKKKAQSLCGLRADLLKFIRKKTIILKY
jgi:hypothetical protein